MENTHIGQVVFDEAAIALGAAKVAEQLNNRYSEAVIITVVPGGILYTADLVRQLKFNVCMDTISCPHTPGDRENKSTIVYHDNVGIRGKEVILVDDAIESGGTMKRLVEFLTEQFSPKSLSIATLFVKPGRVSIPVPQFYAYEMDNDDLLVGYGLPWENKYRNLPVISKLNLK